MKAPQDYVDYVDLFIESGHSAVRLDGANREDAACLRMVCYLREYDVEVLIRKGNVYLRREEDASAGN